MTTGKAPIAVALDARDIETAARWARAVTPHVSTVKVGLELFCRHGPEAVAAVRGASGVGSGSPAREAPSRNPSTPAFSTVGPAMAWLVRYFTP